MPALIDTFRRHQPVLAAAGWLWREQEVESVMRSVGSERLTLACFVLDRWLTNNPKVFVRVSTGGLGIPVSLTFLSDVLSWKHWFLLIGLAEEGTGPVAEVAASAGPLLRSDGQLAGRLLSLLTNGPPETSLPFPDHMLERGLIILERASCLNHLAVFLVPLLRHHNCRIRSKAALLLATANQNPKVVYQRFTRESDPRVRANLIEGLWDVNAPGKAEVLWKASRDSHHRVVANALFGLCQMGDQQATTRLEEMALHASGNMRAAAAWAMGETRQIRFQPTLARLFKEECGGQKRSALRALVRIRQATQQSGAAATSPPFATIRTR